MAVELNGMTSLNPVQQDNSQITQLKQQPEKSFGTVLKHAIDNVSKQENESDLKAELLAEGKTDNLHDVMISAQKASIKVETAVEVQQKAIDIYNEMMRMQI